MYQVLVAQSSHLFRVDSCIYQGMEIHFSYDAEDCLNKLNNHRFDALILQYELRNKGNMSASSILNEKSEDSIPVFLISRSMNEEVMGLLFCCRIHHYFMEPISYREVFDKLSEIKGNQENHLLEKRVKELLYTLGIPSSVQGYSYLLKAIVNCYYQEDYLKGITKRLYPMLADEHKTTAGAVEKSIRHAIEMAFSHCDQTFLYSFFKGTIRSDKAKATNSQFISMCVGHMKTEGL
ncbi:MAG: hypothetical protein E7192_03305 [Erysipelotrichaceae bacterium]|nr:hypothetical protein [Erysipelotrichaceae bacterium]